MDDTTLFLGPDPAIMRDHSITGRTPLEEECIAKGIDPLQVDRIRKRLAGALDEGYEMCEAMGAAPGAKWGDLTTAIYTASGDVTYLSCHGVIAFSAILHHPIRYIMKYWKDEPTVGIHPGDGFIHNDARYGNVHNTDQSMIMPIIRDGEIIAWVAATIHEGENGACEPGGMPSGSETPFDDGLRMSPFKIVESGRAAARPGHLPAALGARPEAAAGGPQGQDRRGPADHGARRQGHRRGRRRRLSSPHCGSRSRTSRRRSAAGSRSCPTAPCASTSSWTPR